MSAADSTAAARLVLFGVTGQLGQELVELLDEAEDAAIGELVGVASPDSAGRTFPFRGQELDVETDWPALKGRDLVFVCTRGPAALEIVRECLRAEVPCVDLTGSLSSQALSAEAGVPLAFAGELEQLSATAPLLTIPSATALAWSALVDAIGAPLTRVRGTVLSSAAALGRAGVVALSEESIALFNQSQGPDPGPAGQAVAFDVLPGGQAETARVRGELGARLGADVGLDVAMLQVPTFVGEGGWVTLEFAEPIDAERVAERLAAAVGVEVVAEGPGSRGLVAVEEEGADLVGPTLRDAAGAEGVLVGRIEPDPSVAEGLAWRVWVVCDPLRLVAAQALAVAGRRLGWS